MSRSWILVIALMLFAQGALGQTGPTSDQLQMFQNLTPEQQQEILRQMSGQGGTSNAASSTSRNASRGRPPDEQARRSRGDQIEAEPLIAVLKPADTVLLQVDLEGEAEPTQPLLPGDPGPNAAMTGQQPANAVASQRSSPVTRNGQLRSVRESEEPDVEEIKRLEDLVTLIRSRNPYQLDRDAQLSLPGFAPIALGGLTELQATQRLSGEPTLLGIRVSVVRLPLAKTGLAGLKRFGYDLFDDVPSTYSPVDDVPVPANYVVGAGDELNVQLYGSQNRSFRLVVSRDGRVNFPELGPISVGGQTFNAARAGIEGRVASEMIGVRASVSMGETRSIMVFVLGEAHRPGSYTVSGLATMTAALFASGGVKPIGTLRDIQLKRQGAVVRRLDLYDLLINGDTSDDARLLPGDAIFIPPSGPTVTVDGEVQRPAIYEIKGDVDVASVIRMAGGLTSEGDESRVNLTQLGADRLRVVNNVDLSSGLGSSHRVRNGDILRVSRLRPQLDSAVTLEGFVFRPGAVAWREGLRLTDVVSSMDELRPNADQNYLLIRRELPPDRRVSVLSADLTAALAAPGSNADVVLMPRDQITVFDLAPGRERIVKPIIEELRLQSALSRPTEVVRVEGKVKVPGEYPLEPGMKISDLIRAGGNLDISAYGGKAELARYDVEDGESRRTELIDVDIAAVRRGDPAANLTLQPFDFLLIKETPDWAGQEAITLTGQVKFPGIYPIRRGETLKSVIIRAGGLTELAFPRGSVFTRKELKEREQEQLDMLSDRLQSDLGSVALQAAAADQSGASSALMAGQSLLTQLQQSKAVGRLVIDLNKILASDANSSNDVVLKDGDNLIVPRQKQEVSVIGEVQSLTSHLYQRNLTQNDYLGLSGGLTRKADKDKIYVVRADGSVVAQAVGMFRRSHAVAIQPGDTIVVPLNTERIPRLPFWQAVTQIVYNLAVSVAAINSF